MKKLLVAGAVALFGLSNAQIAKGTVYLSGTVNYSQEETQNGNVKEEKLNVIPTVGYFVAPNLAVGVGVGYKTQTNTEVETLTFGPTTTVNTTKFKQPAFVVEPFVRKYWTLSDKLYFFGQLAVPMQFGKSELEGTSVTTTGSTVSTTTVSTEAKYTQVGVTVKPGLDYFLNKNWTIEATIGEFGYNNYKPKEGDATNNYNFGLNLANVGIGVKYVFAK
ncbi:opacity protein [Chryseobacterium sp. CBo1]|uniref:outer membrane protein n=1 Tax=Chryseobacterium sp. CBo1 TaxID=1869230 RepID=UPI0008105D71|nr:outer membrane beta-barrel protein [Chryseobacterium sp. CBo1]OCK52483.1 opacity protein [Chryseobacterium sp. CBo1]